LHAKHHFFLLVGCCRALGVFILWVFLIHMGCIAYHKLRGSSATVQTLGINCLLLTTNNTGAQNVIFVLQSRYRARCLHTSAAIQPGANSTPAF
jgi:hypothetical protein